MHACLNVDEIVRLIAHELVAFSGEGSAVSLACSCKSFEDPVLDALWAKQRSLLLLLKSLPGDVWKEGGCSVSAPTTRVFFSLLKRFIRKSFRRLPTMTEWVRFRKYARRMRELSRSITPDCQSPEVLSVMQLFTIKEPLLPNLKTLKLWGIKQYSIPFIPLFLSQRTTSITLGFESNLPEATVASMITTLPTLCPDLQAIYLQNIPRNPMVITAVSRMLLVTNRNTLQEYHGNSLLTEEASDVLYKLPNLRVLSVFVGGGGLHYPRHRFQI